MRRVFGEVRREEEAVGAVEWRVVDAGREVDVVAGDVWEVVGGVVEEVEKGGRGEVGRYAVGAS